MTDRWAIDLGTTNTVVSRWQVDAPATINLPDVAVPQQPTRTPVIPTVVYVLDPAREEVLIGRKAQEEDWTGKSASCFRSFKRQLARKRGVVTRLAGHEYHPERVATLFLRELFARLQARYEAPVEDVTFTVPVEFFEPYREALSRIATRLGVKRVGTIDEPVAAAVGYGLHLDEDQRVLVVDFGGGTLDTALIGTGRGKEWEEGRARVLAKAGESLGGDDIDSWIMEAVAGRFKKRMENFAHLHRLLKDAAEKTKIDLSTRESSPFTVFDDRAGRSLDQVFTRAELEEILRQNGLFGHVTSVLDRTMAAAARSGVDRHDVDHVLLIGGSSLIPSVRTLVQDYFGADKVREHLPFEAVAHGACAFAHGLSRPVDFIQHSYGLRTFDRDAMKHDYQLLVEKGTVYPTVPELIAFTLAAAHPNQQEIELLIFEIGTEQGNNEYVWQGNQLRRIDRRGENVVCINEAAPTLARLNPAGNPGYDRLQVSFRVDADRHLCVTVRDLLRGVDLLLDQPVVQLK